MSRALPPSPLDGLLEHPTRTNAASEQAALTSIAISLKRIADTLDGTTAGICVTQTIFAGHINASVRTDQ